MILCFMSTKDRPLLDRNEKWHTALHLSAADLYSKPHIWFRLNKNPFKDLWWTLWIFFKLFQFDIW